MSLLDDLVSYWKLDEASGNAIDAHSTNDLTETSGTIGSATGKINGARDLENGDTELFSLADGSFTGFPTGTELSISFWLSLETDSGIFQVIMSKANFAGSTTFWIQILNSGGGATVNLIEAGNGFCPNGTFAADGWHHYVMVFDGSLGTDAARLKFYKDGSQVTFSSVSGVPTSLTDSTAPFELGGNTVLGGGRYVDGLMDEVGLWGRALSSAEVTELYNSGNGLSYDDFGGGGGTVKRLLLMGVG